MFQSFILIFFFTDVYEPCDPDVVEKIINDKSPPVTPAKKHSISQQEDIQIEENDDIYEPIVEQPPPPPPSRSRSTPPSKHSDSAMTPPSNHRPPLPSPSSARPPLPSPPSSDSPPALPTRNPSLPPAPKMPLPETPKQKRTPKLVSLNHHPSEDFENMYYGIWASKSSSDNELSFERGDLIHIINRELDSDNWWIGELKGNIGLVPKTFMLPAYQAVP